MQVYKKLGWGLLMALGALALGVIAVWRGEPINAVWLMVAAGCVFALGYRFYSRYLAYRVLELNDRRATPAERLEDGREVLSQNHPFVCDNTSRPSQGLARWWGQSWRRSSDTCRERSG